MKKEIILIFLSLFAVCTLTNEMVHRNGEVEKVVIVCNGVPSVTPVLALFLALVLPFI